VSARSWTALWLPAVVLSLVAMVCGAETLPQGFDPAQAERQIEKTPLPDHRPAAAATLEATKTRVDLPEQAFILSGVLIEGATVYSNLDFLPSYQPYLGQRVTVRELRAIADAITRRYQDDGFFLSNAVLPAQSIEFGVVRIRVVEGYIRDWRVIDGAETPDARIDRILQPVLAWRPVRRADLISTLKRLGDLPGLTLEPNLRAVEPPGAYELLLGVRRKRFEGAISIDNRGSEAIGPTRAIAAFRLLNPTGRYEAYQLKLATAEQTRELGYGDASTDWRHLRDRAPGRRPGAVGCPHHQPAVPPWSMAAAGESGGA